MDGSFDGAGYARDGFGVVRGAVPGPFLAALGAAVRRVQDGVDALPPELRERLTFERDLPADRRGGVEAGAVGDAIFILGDSVAFDPLFRAVLRQPAIVRAVRTALGVREAVAHFMNVTIKHPRFGRGIGWHRDYPNGYATPEASLFVRTMLCLDGMSADGGATAFIPGSHHLSDAEAEGCRLPKGWQPGAGEAVTVVCRPGDLVLIHPKVLHGGGMNASAVPRRNIVVQAGPAGVPLRSDPVQEAVLGVLLGG